MSLTESTSPERGRRNGHPPPVVERALQPHLRWLRTVVCARVGEPQAVEDVMQEVAVAAVAGNPPADHQRWAPWLYRVAVRQSLLYRRRQGRQRRFRQRFARDNHSHQQTASPDPLTGILHHEQIRTVREALAKLPDIERQLLILKYTEDWTCRQLAAHLGVAETTVEYRLLRARKRLRKELAARDITARDITGRDNTDRGITGRDITGRENTEAKS